MTITETVGWSWWSQGNLVKTESRLDLTLGSKDILLMTAASQLMIQPTQILFLTHSCLNWTMISLWCSKFQTLVIIRRCSRCSRAWNGPPSIHPFMLLFLYFILNSRPWSAVGSTLYTSPTSGDKLALIKRFHLVKNLTADYIWSIYIMLYMPSAPIPSSTTSLIYRCRALCAFQNVTPARQITYKWFAGLLPWLPFHHLIHTSAHSVDDVFCLTTAGWTGYVQQTLNSVSSKSDNFCVIPRFSKLLWWWVAMKQL